MRVPIETHHFLERDTHSKGITNTDASGRSALLHKRNAEMKKIAEAKLLREDVDSLRSDIATIKASLAKILEKL